MERSKENFDALLAAGKKVRQTGKDTKIIVSGRVLTIGYPAGLKIQSNQELKKKTNSQHKLTTMKNLTYVFGPSGQGKSYSLFYAKYKLYQLSPEEVKNKISVMIKENSIDQKDIDWAKKLLRTLDKG